MWPPNGLRNAHIGVAVAVVILLVTLVFFNDAAEGVIQAIGMFAFFSAFAVYHALDELERRRERRGDRR
jgi:hypothetical protein